MAARMFFCWRGRKVFSEVAIGFFTGAEFWGVAAAAVGEDDADCACANATETHVRISARKMDFIQGLPDLVIRKRGR